MNTPISPRDGSSELVTVYYSLEEGWIHVLHFNAADVALASMPARSELMPYSESQMRYLRVRAEADPNIFIFQAHRDTP